MKYENGKYRPELRGSLIHPYPLTTSLPKESKPYTFISNCGHPKKIELFPGL